MTGPGSDQTIHCAVDDPIEYVRLWRNMAAVGYAPRQAGTGTLVATPPDANHPDWAEGPALQAVLASTHEAIITFDLAGRPRLCNDRARCLLDAFRGDCVASAGRTGGAGLYAATGGERLALDEMPQHCALRGLTVEDQPLLVVVQDTSPREMIAHARPILDQDSILIGATVALADQTAIKDMQRELQWQSDVYAALSEITQLLVQQPPPITLHQHVCRTLIEHGAFILAWIGHIGDDGWVKPVASNGAAAEYLTEVSISVDPQRLEGQGAVGRAIRQCDYEIVPAILADTDLAPFHGAAHRHGLRSCGAFPLTRGGAVSGVLVVYSNTANQFTQQLIGLLEQLAADVSFGLDHHDQRRALAELTLHNPLTGLSNRSNLVERLDRHIERRQWIGDGHDALICLSIDALDDVRASLGQTIGDELVAAVGQRLQTVVRANDLVGHTSDAIFAIVVTELERELEDNAVAVTRLAQRAQQALSEISMVQGHRLQVSVSAGIALYPFDAIDAGALLQAGETAAHRAAAQGRGSLRFYERRMLTSTRRRLTLEQDLRFALQHEREQFCVVYQGIRELSTGNLAGMEALLRWNHPERGLVSPAEFIPIAESTGLILELSEWLTGCVVDQVVDWQKHGGPNVPVAINVSPREFASDRFTERVHAALAGSDKELVRIELEVTEGLLLEHIDTAVEKMHALRARGIAFALDDFGTGYSSLSYLHRLPLSRLKIDRSFIAALGRGEGAEGIIEAMLAMARHLDLEIVAEGVEEPAQADFLAERGCPYVQGFLYDRPRAAVDWQ